MSNPLDMRVRPPDGKTMHPIADLLVCLRFFSRLPVPTTRREIDLGAAGLAAAAWMAPVAGALIGGLAALVLVATSAAGLPPLLAAPLAIAASLLVTGALHEDGLADCADGFGGGRTRDRTLEIMRDSRIGTFGACAVALSLYLRAMALGIVAARAPALAIVALVTAGVLSRTACLLPLVLLPPARPDGAGAATRPSGRTFGIAFVLAIALALCLCGVTQVVGRLVIAIIATGVVSLAWCALARRKIGGQTGDVAGATQQLAEIAVLLAFAAT